MSEGWLHKYVLPLLPNSLIPPSPFSSSLCSSQPNASADHSKELPGDGCKKLLLLKLVVISHFHTISPSLSLDVYDVNFSIILFDPKVIFYFKLQESHCTPNLVHKTNLKEIKQKLSHTIKRKSIKLSNHHVLWHSETCVTEEKGKIIYI